MLSPPSRVSPELEEAVQQQPPFDPSAYLPITGQLSVSVSSGRLAVGTGGRAFGKFNPYVCAEIVFDVYIISYTHMYAEK